MWERYPFVSHKSGLWTVKLGTQAVVNDAKPDLWGMLLGNE